MCVSNQIVYLYIIDLLESTLHATTISRHVCCIHPYIDQRKQRRDPPPTPVRPPAKLRAHTHSQCSSSFTLGFTCILFDEYQSSITTANGCAYIASRSAAPQVTRPKRKRAVKIGAIASRRPVAGASPTTTRSKGRRRLLLALGRNRRKVTTVAPAPEREAVGRNERKGRMASNGVAGEEDAVEAMETEMSPDPNGIKEPPTVIWRVDLSVQSPFLACNV